MSDKDVIKCGKCGIPLVGPKNPKPEDVFSCPKCGASDRYDKIIDEVKRQLRKSFDNSIKKAFGPGSGWKLTKK